MSRVYLDWNATAPLRPEARAAMIAAMDVVGNPSSVHAEGRAAKGLVETARAQVAEFVGCAPSEVVFTSGATEANQFVTKNEGFFQSSGMEHESIEFWAKVAKDEENFDWINSDGASPIGAEHFSHRCNYRVEFTAEQMIESHKFFNSGQEPGFVLKTLMKLSEKKKPDQIGSWWHNSYPNELRYYAIVSCIAACGETGVVNHPAVTFSTINRLKGLAIHTDSTQMLGRLAFDFRDYDIDLTSASSHKLGGPKGSGLLVLKDGIHLGDVGLLAGGGQEMGRRSGTENVIGIAGFGAAAAAAQRDLADGVWDRVAELRDRMEEVLLNEALDILIFGKDVARLPNTSCFAIPGWKGETQVMQMDLAGYAISAGSACSSGKVKESRVLRAMGFDSETASSAIRVSLGPTTTEDEIMGFARTWIEHYRRFKQRAA
ncbi:cysteine desulfurase family protein [Halovulum sp. GXIMD14793]